MSAFHNRTARTLTPEQQQQLNYDVAKAIVWIHLILREVVSPDEKKMEYLARQIVEIGKLVDLPPEPGQVVIQTTGGMYLQLFWIERFITGPNAGQSQFKPVKQSEL